MTPKFDLILHRDNLITSINPMPRSPLKKIRSRLFARKGPLTNDVTEEKRDNSPVTVTEEIRHITPIVKRSHLTTLSKKKIDSDLQHYAEEQLRNKIGSLLFVDGANNDTKSPVVYSKNKLGGRTLVISESKDDQVQVKFSELPFNPEFPSLHTLEIPEEDNEGMIDLDYYTSQSQTIHSSVSPPRSPSRSLSYAGSTRSSAPGTSTPPMTSISQYMYPDENEHDLQQILEPRKRLSFGEIQMNKMDNNNFNSLSDTARQKMGIEYSYSKGSILDAYSDDDDSSILESNPSPQRYQDKIHYENQENINEVTFPTEYNDQNYTFDVPQNIQISQDYTSKINNRYRRKNGCINFMDVGCNSFQDSLMQGVRIIMGNNENDPYCSGNTYPVDDDLLLAKIYSNKSNLDDGVDLYVSPSPSAVSKSSRKSRSSKKRKKKKERKK